jgi:hypothetical protein
MNVTLSVDHRLAFVLLVALVLAAAIPLALAWARIIPEERPPFEIGAGSRRPPEAEAQKETPPSPRRDPVALSLLVFVTLCYIVRFPGFPWHVTLQWWHSILPGPLASWVILGGKILLVAATSAAVCYSAIRPHPSRVVLGVSAALVLLLWFLAPSLYAALLATS